MKRLRAIITMIAAAGLLLPGMASALTFAPPTYDLTADPGQLLEETLKLKNGAPDPVTITLGTANFTAKAGDVSGGIPSFYPSTEVGDGHGLGPWISFDKPEITLASGEQVSLPFRIQVPKDAGPGSYFGAVVFETHTPSSALSVGLTGNAAALVLLRVNGNVVEDLKLQSFAAAPVLAGSLPVRFIARVRNDGTVHLHPYGEVTIKNLFGQTVATVPINRAEFKSVLPGNARDYQTEWHRKILPANTNILTREWQNFALGPYTAELTFRYGDKGTLLTAKAGFWVIPWLVLLLLGGGAAALFLSLRWLMRRYRDYVLRDYERRHPS